MLLEPMTPSTDLTTKMIFRLPLEFGYESIKYLDDCEMIGKTTDSM